MSCFMMSAQSVSDLAEWIAALLNQPGNSTLCYGPTVPDSLRRIALKRAAGRQVYSERAIFTALHALNVIAYNGRYPDDPADLLPVPDYCPRHAFRSLEWENADGGYYRLGRWVVEMAKRFTCFLYQCDERPASDLPLFRALRELETRLNGFIVANLRAYVVAPWG